MIPHLNDYTSLPIFPAPWSIKGNKLVASNGLEVKAPGTNITGYANLPTTKSQATLRAKKLKAMGVRIVRTHKIDVMLLDNWGSHSVRFQWWLDSLKKQGIPVTIEFNSEAFPNDGVTENKGFVEFLAKLSTLDLSNVVMASPLNEYPLNDYRYDYLCDRIRSIAKYSGLLFSSNAMVQPGEFGEIADCHIYCGHEGQPADEFMEIRYKDQPWNHPKPQKLPVVCLEAGHLWPSSTRFESERDIFKAVLAVDAQVICSFAYATNAGHWSSAKQRPDMYAYHNDLQRLEAFEWLVNKMVGREFVPWSQKEGFGVESIGNGRWRVREGEWLNLLQEVAQ